MPTIVYSHEDVVSSRAGEVLKRQAGLTEAAPLHGMRRFQGAGVDLLELKEHHLYSDDLDALGTDLIVVLSRHTSEKGVRAFCVHPVGNWTGEAKIGGRPRELGVAAPVAMLRCLKALSAMNSTSLAVTYEATHHGPLLKTPLMYAELGGHESVHDDQDLLGILTGAVLNSLDMDAPYEKVALGIGGLHYESKFTRLALEGKYAFSHMMSKYYVGEVDMLAQAASRSQPVPEVAVIEWKSITSEQRTAVIRKLSEIGLDYIRV